MTPVRLLFVDDQLTPGSPERESLLRRCAVKEVEVSAATASGSPTERLAAFSTGKDGHGTYTYEAIHDAVKAGPGPEGWSIVLLDVTFGRDRHLGERIRRRLLAEHPHLPVVLLTSRRQGELLSDEAPYLSKDDLNAHGLNRALLDHGRLTPEQVRALLNLKEEIAVSPAMLEVFRQAMRVAATEARVLLLGETGVGKEIVARYIHRLSARRERRFEGENMAVVGATDRALLAATLFGRRKDYPNKGDAEMEGLFGKARHGTLFLDEVAELPAETQGSLLRVLQESRYRRLGEEHETEADIRLITATSRDLDDLVRTGAFRDDLYHRIAKVRLHIPPLQSRLEDVRPLAEHFLASKQGELGLNGVEFSGEALQVLETHPFPGNVRELESIVERILIEKGSNALITERDARKAAAESPTTLPGYRGQRTRDEQTSLPPSAPELALANLPDHLDALPVTTEDADTRGILLALERAFARLMRRVAGAALADAQSRRDSTAHVVRRLFDNEALEKTGIFDELDRLLAEPPERYKTKSRRGSVQVPVDALIQAWREGPPENAPPSGTASEEQP